MADSILNQFGDLAKLPAQYFKTQSSKGDLYDLKKKLKVKQNETDPTYAKRAKKAQEGK